MERKGQKIMEQKNEGKARKDCIFFCEESELRKKDECAALRKLYCRTEDCKFYKRKEAAK